MFFLRGSDLLRRVSGVSCAPFQTKSATRTKGRETSEVIADGLSKNSLLPPHPPLSTPAQYTRESEFDQERWIGSGNIDLLDKLTARKETISNTHTEREREKPSKERKKERKKERNR